MEFTNIKIDPKAYRYVDLGLPSGTQWADTNVFGIWKADDAVKKAGDALPTRKDFDELTAKCRWEWDSKKKQYTITGPNGNSITMQGDVIAMPDANGKTYKDDVGYYLMADDSKTPGKKLVFKFKEKHRAFTPQDPNFSATLRLVKHADTSRMKAMLLSKLDPIQRLALETVLSRAAKKMKSTLENALSACSISDEEWKAFLTEGYIDATKGKELTAALGMTDDCLENHQFTSQQDQVILKAEKNKDERKALIGQVEAVLKYNNLTKYKAAQMGGFRPKTIYRFFNGEELSKKTLMDIESFFATLPTPIDKTGPLMNTTSRMNRKNREMLEQLLKEKTPYPFEELAARYLEMSNFSSVRDVRKYLRRYNGTELRILPGDLVVPPGYKEPSKGVSLTMTKLMEDVPAIQKPATKPSKPMTKTATTIPAEKSVSHDDLAAKLDALSSEMDASRKRDFAIKELLDKILNGEKVTVNTEQPAAQPPDVKGFAKAIADAVIQAENNKLDATLEKFKLPETEPKPVDVEMISAKATEKVVEAVKQILQRWMSNNAPAEPAADTKFHIPQPSADVILQNVQQMSRIRALRGKGTLLYTTITANPGSAVDVKALARQTRLSVRKVKRLLEKLQKKGFLELYPSVLTHSNNIPQLNDNTSEPEFIPV